MKKFIDKLPQDIIYIIISYTYNLQNKELLDDIQNYTKAKKELLHNYYDYWISYINEEEPEDKYWLINDLISYSNNYKATMYGYTNNFYDIFYRNLLLKTNQDVDKYIINLDNKNANSQINIILGLLTKQQRDEFICNTYFTKVI
jgi:hypothetical protein